MPNHSILHVIVGDSPWANAPIRYRRHRLAECITRHETTADVFWIYPRREPAAAAQRPPERVEGGRVGAPTGAADARPRERVEGDHAGVSAAAADRRRIERVAAARAKAPAPAVAHGRSSERVQDGHAELPAPANGARVREFGIPLRRHRTLYNDRLQRALLADVNGAVARHPATSKVLWFTIPSYASLLSACDWDQVVYDCSDFWRGLAAEPTVKLKARLAAPFRARAEARIIHGSNVLFASSVYLAEWLQQSSGRAPILVENGVQASSFRDAAPAADLERELPPRPRVAFFGPLKPHRVHFELLRSLASAAPDYSLVLVGPAADRAPQLDALLQLPNVTWLGARKPEQVPALMKLMDVGLLPYRETPYHEGAFPVKFFEYLAAGLPVVGCALPSTHAYGEKGVYIHTEPTSAAFVAACREALGWDESAARRVQLAEMNDWSPKTARMLEEVLTRLTDGREPGQGRAVTRVRTTGE